MDHTLKPYTFFKTDDNMMVNVNYIRWIKKHDDCFHICSTATACGIFDNKEFVGTMRVCKNNTPKSYNELNELFDNKS